MRVERYKGGGRAGRVLAGMATDAAVCGAVAARWDAACPPFDSRWENLVGGWCVRHYRDYRKPPGAALAGHFDAWAEAGTRDAETVRLVEDFLTSLSDAPKADAEYLIGEAAKAFDAVLVRRLRDELDADLDKGDLDGAKARVRNFAASGLGQAEGVSFYDDEAGIQSAFQNPGENVFKFGQEPLDAFFAGMLEPESFVSFVGKPKGTKSLWLQEVVWLASRYGTYVGFFEVGDQSKRQLYRRMAARAAGRPFRADPLVKVPLSMTGGDPPQVEYETKSYKKPMSAERAVRAVAEAAKAPGVGKIRVSVHSNSSVTVEGIETVIRDWERADGKLPQLVVIDYADLLAPLSKTLSERDQINETWKALRRLSQDLKCAVVTATQTKAAALTAKNIGKEHWADDSRKVQQVTGMVAINRFGNEEKNQTFRLNWLYGRDLDFSESVTLHAAGCLALANPCVKTAF